MKPEMETELAEVADVYLNAPAALQAAIVKAAAGGEKAPAIFLAIRQAYSLDYVREIISNARKAGKIPPRKQADDAQETAAQDA